MHPFRYWRGILAAILLAFPCSFLYAADALTSDQKEEFLRKSKVVKVKEAAKGVTGTLRVTLNDGKITHDASVQRINEAKTVYQTTDGHTELNFKDSYAFNIAGWRLAKLVGLENMVPPSVERAYQGTSASFTWWIDDIMMDEVDRLSRKTEAPDQDAWTKEVAVMHAFDELIYNMDPNATNILIDKQWHIWLIDHTRAFRLPRTLHNPANLSRIDRTMLARMKALDEGTLKKEFGRYASRDEIRGLLGRRDVMVKFFEGKGESVLFDRPQRD
jgi:hypothetical protein